MGIEGWREVGEKICKSTFQLLLSRCSYRTYVPILEGLFLIVYFELKENFWLCPCAYCKMYSLERSLLYWCTLPFSKGFQEPAAFVMWLVEWEWVSELSWVVPDDCPSPSPALLAPPSPSPQHYSVYSYTVTHLS